MSLTGAERTARYRLKHPEKIKADNASRDLKATYLRQKELWAAEPQKYLWKNARDRCRKSGRTFTIRPEDIVINTKCPYLDIDLILMSEGHAKDNVMTLDRKDNSLGYVPGNIEVISYRANRIKCDATAEELLKIGTRMNEVTF